LKIFLLGDTQHPNAQNWVHAFKHYGGCEVQTWSLPWPDGKSGRLVRFSAWLKALFTVKKEIRAFNPDIVIGYRLTSYGFIAAFTGIQPLVIAAQGETDVWPPGHWSLPIKRALAKYAIKKSALVHAWGDHMAQSVYELGAEKSKVLILPRGIDLKNFTAGIPEKSFDRLRLIVTRALYKEYGHETIIRAVKQLHDAQIPVELFIAGTGVEENNLKQLAAELGLTHLITFAGRLNNASLKSHLLHANVYLSMPDTEGVSASLLEAMACYCIPVVSDLVANRMWIENKKNGLLIPVYDAGKLYEALKEIWYHQASFTGMLEHNRKLVEEKGSQEKNTKVFIEHYQQLVKKNQS
jgi:glycosyltransferase involved in cell wall biosynthesis